MKIQCKYSPGNRVYVYTKKGLELREIQYIRVRVCKAETLVIYYISDYEDGYTEDLIIDNYKKAVTRLEENKAQLQLALPTT